MLLKDLHENITKVGIMPTNLNGDKRIIVRVNGLNYTCSTELSKMIRDKKVSLSELPHYEVREITLESGEVINSLGMVGFVEVEINPTATSPKPVFDLERLAELVAI